MCDVPSIVVFCGESIEHFYSIASKFFLKPFVIIPVAPIVTSIIIHFMFHIVASLYINSCILAAFSVVVVITTTTTTTVVVVAAAAAAAVVVV